MLSFPLQFMKFMTSQKVWMIYGGASHHRLRKCRPPQAERIRQCSRECMERVAAKVAAFTGVGEVSIEGRFKEK